MKLRKLILGSLLLLLLFINAAAFATDRKDEKILFFPYAHCIVCTIQAVTVVKPGEGCSRGKYRVNVKIEDPIRGEYRKGELRDFLFTDPPEGFLPEANCESCYGRKCVFAFNRSPITLEPVSLYAPFKYQKFDEKQLRKLRAEVTNVVDDAGCVVIELKKIELFGKYLSIQGLILDALRCSPFKQGNEITIYYEEPVKDLLPDSLQLDGKGARMVCRMCSRRKGEYGSVNHPFPRQKFTELELSDLKKHYSSFEEQRKQLDEEFVSYLQKRWNLAKLKDYCKPETRQVPVPWLANLAPSEGHRWGLKMHDKVDDDLGDVRVSLSDYVGAQACAFAIMVRKGNDFWFPESGNLVLESMDDGEFFTLRVRHALENIEMNSRWAKRCRIPEESRIQYEIACDELMFDDSGKRFYKAILKNGKKLTARLDKEGNVSAVLIDGIVSDGWSHAILHNDENVRYGVEVNKSYR